MLDVDITVNGKSLVDFLYPYLDWFGYGFIVMGMSIGSPPKAKIQGWYHAIIGGIILMFWAYHFSHWGAIFWNAVFLATYFHIIWKMRKS